MGKHLGLAILTRKPAVYLLYVEQKSRSPPHLSQSLALGNERGTYNDSHAIYYTPRRCANAPLTPVKNKSQ